MCLIINNETFVVSRRAGADEDEKLRKGLFQELDFSAMVKRGLTRERILETVRNFAGKDHHQFDAFVFAILSHSGDNDVKLGFDEKTISIRELMCLFTATNFPSLKAKPKLYFIQACRGESDTLLRSVCPQEAPLNDITSQLGFTIFYAVFFIYIILSKTTTQKRKIRYKK